MVTGLDPSDTMKIQSEKKHVGLAEYSQKHTKPVQGQVMSWLMGRNGFEKFKNDQIIVGLTNNEED